jgi:hypothetical protein
VQNAVRDTGNRVFGARGLQSARRSLVLARYPARAA